MRRELEAFVGNLRSDKLTSHQGARETVEQAFRQAEKIADEDRSNNLKMAQVGARALQDNGSAGQILTHCNTGGLATGGYGTALGVVRACDQAGDLERAWIDETRPYLQGARLTTWECLKDNIPATLITDSMAAHFMSQGEVDAVVVGTDRVVANGDVANKIGTYGLAVLAEAHDIPFYVAAPISTIDLETPSGDEVTIEQRSREEVVRIGDTDIAPEGIDVAHPAFDITPAEYVTGIITERGLVTPPYDESLENVVSQARPPEADGSTDAAE
jgi:methylthioribose-1-phosphate isomerase